MTTYSDSLYHKLSEYVVMGFLLIWISQLPRIISLATATFAMQLASWDWAQDIIARYNIRYQ